MDTFTTRFRNLVFELLEIDPAALSEPMQVQHYVNGLRDECRDECVRGSPRDLDEGEDSARTRENIWRSRAKATSECLAIATRARDAPKQRESKTGKPKGGTAGPYWLISGFFADLSSYYVDTVQTCCVIGCANRSESGRGIRFFRIPSSTNPVRRSCQTTEDLRVRRREKWIWIAAIRRKDWATSADSRVCSAHFISGTRIVFYVKVNCRALLQAHFHSYRMKRTLIGFPSLRMGYSFSAVSTKTSMGRYERHERRRGLLSAAESERSAARAIETVDETVDMTVNERLIDEPNDDTCMASSCQKDMSFTAIRTLESEFQRMTDERDGLREAIGHISLVRLIEE